MSDGRIDAPAGEGSRSGLQYGPKDRSRAAALVMDAKKIFPQREDSLKKRRPLVPAAAEPGEKSARQRPVQSPAYQIGRF